MICLLQLRQTPLSALWSAKSTGKRRHVLSARVETAGLGHLVAELLLGADLPGPAGDAEDDGREEERVALPVGRLGVPATGRRPDVLGVARGGFG